MATAPPPSTLVMATGCASGSTPSRFGTAVAGHIHGAAKGKAGPVVVPLFMGDVPSRTRCVRAKRSLVRDILRDPADYYVNVHTPDFPDGAIRGQLTK